MNPLFGTWASSVVNWFSRNGFNTNILIFGFFIIFPWDTISIIFLFRLSATRSFSISVNYSIVSFSSYSEIDSSYYYLELLPPFGFLPLSIAPFIFKLKYNYLNADRYFKIYFGLMRI